MIIFPHIFKDYDNLSALEKLPNEVYETILGFSDPEAKKSLRVPSRWYVYVY